VFDRSSNTLRVLHVFRYFRPDFTGEGLYLEKLARHLAPLDIRSDVVVECSRKPAVAKHLEGIGDIRFFSMGTGQQRRFPAAMTMWFAARAFRYDVVHFHAFVDRTLLFHVIARLSGCRVVQSSTLDDGLASVVHGYRPLYRPLLRRLCGLIDTVLAISPRLHADNLAVLPAGRSVLIPQGVDLRRAAPIHDRARCRARWEFHDRDVVLLFVGGLCVRKDVIFLVETQATVAAGNGPVKLLLVGPQMEDGYMDSLRQAIARCPCAADIILEGYMDDPSPAYGAADVFVFASREEGFGNVLIEAMAWALPVASRRLPGVTDAIIEHGVTGLLFETASDYQHAVRGLLADATRRRTIGHAAWEAVQARFDLRVISRRYADLYRSLVAGPRAVTGRRWP
jgi:glycosyltransferase involved in cell wall biosynthesis